MDNVTITNIIERTQHKLEKQQTALKATLDELELATKVGADAPAVNAIRIKRDRQHAAILAATNYIKALHTAIKKGQ